jgi:hypothetical protein
VFGHPASTIPVVTVPAPTATSAASTGPTPTVPPSAVRPALSVGGAGSFVPPVFRFSPLVAIKRAVAYQVLTALATEAAERDGHVVSLSAARAFAEKQYLLWRAHPATLPPGRPKPVFFSARAVAGYRQILTIEKEMTVIAGSQEAGDRTPALRQWMTRQLTTNNVVIVGVPALTAANLAASLPPNL